MPVEWTLKTRASFVRTMNFVRERSPGAASRAYVLIHEATQQLAQFPRSGRPIHEIPIDASFSCGSATIVVMRFYTW